ncbi:MAG: hypothetical protein A2V81_00645 [Candidatus Abawacabacteria bacterium RBG_16_42_10]|uniref:Uncharacterized protein n=1 Tax=Candidatus Abawacabacteria bacterium RBG_16_42_10 TaxID=1817814 RepID=A0A1F4XKT0_9BACT|nr:MAG: hypothetical protein A2V81_00645 [Candidatus Abawacabacteria bacterium RBG_16_42_10]
MDSPFYGIVKLKIMKKTFDNTVSFVISCIGLTTMYGRVGGRIIQALACSDLLLSGVGRT